jgi:4-carboxymuconolactone decarboxylase
MTSILSKGQPAPKEYFTGNVWVNMVVQPADNLNSVIGKVTFEQKARTNWHSHPNGQILIVTDGIGYFQEKGNPIQIMRTGDVIKFGPDVVHWHGASLHSELVHTSIVPSSEPVSTIWLQPVTEEEYNDQKPIY